jgi:uridine kinase
MIGDKLLIEPHHTARALDLCDLLAPRLGSGRLAFTVAGESGSGKSELAAELARELKRRGHAAGVLAQDDYFVFPPRTNHEMRKRNIEQVGPFEVKLDFLDSNLRSFKRGESPILKPLVIYDEDRITREELDVSQLEVLIAEGTYTTRLELADAHIFINRNYRQTLDARKKRARDKFEPFIVDVLEREHQIISAQKARAHFVITPDFHGVQVL